MAWSAWRNVRANVEKWAYNTAYGNGASGMYQSSIMRSACGYT
jgi:hypothetical protein